MTRLIPKYGGYVCILWARQLYTGCRGKNSREQVRTCNPRGHLIKKLLKPMGKQRGSGGDIYFFIDHFRGYDKILTVVRQIWGGG